MPDASRFGESQSLHAAIYRDGAREFVTVDGVCIDVTGADSAFVQVIRDPNTHALAKVVYVERGTDVQIVEVSRETRR